MISKFLQIAGFGLCVLCMVYMVYIAASEQALTKLTASGEKALVIAGMAALTEGEVVRADDGGTVIRYYHEWDGTYYQYVRSNQVPDYQTGKRMPVVYTMGMGAGTCLIVGCYRNVILCTGVAGVILLLLGTVLNLKKKGNQ